MSLDDELLMLAGEDSDDSLRPSSPAPSSPKKRRPTSSSAPKRRKKPRHGSDSEDAASDDDDDALPSDEDSYASSPRQMDLNSLASDASDDEDVKDMYPLEGKYTDAADKARLLAMTEVEREAVLAERAATLERAHQDRQLRNLLRSRNENAASAGVRKSSRTKSEPKKSEAMTKRGKLDELKRTREERKMGTGRERNIADEDASRRLLDDDDGEGYAEDVEVKEEREIELGDVNRCVIGRSGFGKLCDYPDFQEAVTDCFVRLSLYDREASRNIYRLAQIKGFTTGKPYSMLDGRRRTDLHLHLCQGKAERSFPMDMMSDGKITEQEFNRFKAQLAADRVPLPSLSLLRRKAQELRDLDAKTLTPEEIDAIIKKRNQGKLDTVTQLARRSDLRKAREYALTMGDDDEVQRIDKELQEIEDILHPRALPRAETAMERMARINALNRKRNMEEIRRAEIAEKHAAREAAKKAEEKGLTPNPFMRVKTTVKFRHDMTDKGKEVEGKKEGETVQEKEKREGMGVGILGNEGTTPVKGRRGGVDDVIASMDIDIEI